MSYLEEPEDKAYICPHCGGDEPIIESSKIRGTRWRGGIKCGVCCLSYKRAREFIPIKKYRELKDWIDKRATRIKEEREREAVERRLGEEIDAIFEASYNEKIEEFYDYLEKEGRL